MHNEKMRDETFYQDLMSRILGNDRFTYSKVLKENDKELLEDYSFLLFNGIGRECKAINAMFGLVKILYAYRYERSPYHLMNDAKQREISYKNQKPQKKFDAFQKKIKKLENSINSVSKLSNELKELFGSDTLHVHQKDFQLKKHLTELQQHYRKLQKQLQDAYINPEQYVPIIPKWKKVSKEDIESYLDNLNLHEKSNVIKSFTEAIK